MNREEQLKAMEAGRPECDKVAEMGAKLAKVGALHTRHHAGLRAAFDALKAAPPSPQTVAALVGILSAISCAESLCEMASQSLADLTCETGLDGRAITVEAHRLTSIAKGANAAEAAAKAERFVAAADAADSAAREVIERARNAAPGGASLH